MCYIKSMINAEINRNEGESALSVIRRFSKRVQGTGLIQEMRGRRYYSRAPSSAVKRKHALQVLKRRAEVKELIELGKMPEVAPKTKRFGR